MMEDCKTVLGIFAHPDDAEFSCSGTLALLQARDWKIHLASMTAGDLGSVELDRKEISTIRKREAKRSAGALDGKYHCLECEDIFIFYDRDTLLKVIKLIRKVKPKIIFTHSPVDYMIDHENTSKLVQTAAFSAGMPNLLTVPVSHFSPVPFLYYSDAFEGKDKFGREVFPTILINISSTIEIKETMLSRHKSQRDWLLKHHGIDEYILSMKRFSSNRGKMIGVNHAEGFRQHLGHAFPQENILQQELGSLCQEIH